jgi:geranylgeranyl diphosphate synthase type 3
VLLWSHCLRIVALKQLQQCKRDKGLEEGQGGGLVLKGRRSIERETGESPLMETDYLPALLASYEQGIIPSWSAHQEEAITEPYTYLLFNPGKDIRTALLHAFNYWLQVPATQLQIILGVVNQLHTASLLIDDVEDGSELRRGTQAAHLRYGQARTINAANYVYFTALRQLRLLPQEAEIVRIYEEEMLNLHRGQGLELFWRDTEVRTHSHEDGSHQENGEDHAFCPTEEEYIAMVNDKTGGLLRLAIRLMQALSNNRTNYVPLANLIGILFQIRDDYMNLASLQYASEKGFCEDLTEGKFSFPVIFGIRQEVALSKRSRIRDILVSKTSTVSLKVEACRLLQQTGAMQHTTQVLAQFDKYCRAIIAKLAGNPQLERILDKLSIQGDGMSDLQSVIDLFDAKASVLDK